VKVVLLQVSNQPGFYLIVALFVTLTGKFSAKRFAKLAALSFGKGLS
jgi:hypothetical protein